MGTSSRLRRCCLLGPTSKPSSLLQRHARKSARIWVDRAGQRGDDYAGIGFGYDLCQDCFQGGWIPPVIWGMTMHMPMFPSRLTAHVDISACCISQAFLVNLSFLFDVRNRTQPLIKKPRPRTQYGEKTFSHIIRLHLSLSLSDTHTLPLFADSNIPSLAFKRMGT
jgi:hypothetical protein